MMEMSEIGNGSMEGKPSKSEFRPTSALQGFSLLNIGISMKY